MERPDRKRKAAVSWHITGLIRFGEPPERFWREDEVAAGLSGDHPDWTPEQIAEVTVRVVDEQLDRLRDWYNSQRRFHRHNKLVGLNTYEPDEDVWEW